MIKNYIEQFESLLREFTYQEEHPENFPYKQSFVETSGLYLNVLSGRLSDGTTGSKTVYVDEAEGLLDAEIIMKVPGIKHLKRIDASFLTVYRTALVAAFTIWKARRLYKKIGFIGGGKINLITAFILSELGSHDFVLIGGRHNVSKNEGCFNTITDQKVETGFDKLLDCETLVVCTNNNDKKDLISMKEAPKATMVIAQDGGYTLARDWRMDWANFSDYPAQLNDHFMEEFPYDRRKRFKNTVFPLHFLKRPTSGVGVYLYGTIVADLVTANYYLANETFFRQIEFSYSVAMKGFEV